MDEPTAVLAPQEIEGLFGTLRSMIAEGKSVIFISHKLQEVTAIADRVTVLRRGAVTAAGGSVDGHHAAGAGAPDGGPRGRLPDGQGRRASRAKSFWTSRMCIAENDKGLPALRGLSLTVRSGEIVGLAGVAGNGQTELSQVISGLRKCDQGQVLLHGSPVSNRSTLFGIQHGMAYIPEDRTHVGTAPDLSITDNVIMKTVSPAADCARRAAGHGGGDEIRHRS